MDLKPRMPPLLPEQWTDEARKMFTLFEGPEAYEQGSKSNVFLTMARHPKLGESFFKYNGRLLMTSKVDERLRELAILRVAWLYRSPYEWAQHVELALTGSKIDPEHIEKYKAGSIDVEGAQGVMTLAEIEAVKRGADDPAWSEFDAAVLRAVDQCKESGHIDEPTWGVLSAAMDEPVLLELLFYIGTYTMLAWVLNACGTQPEDRQRHYAEDLLGSI